MKEKVILRKHGLFAYRTIILGMVALLAIILIAAPGCSSSGSEGDAAPDFTLNDLEGNPVKLSDLQGKTVFLNFWATTCVYCAAEMPDMETLHQKYQDQDVVILGVNMREKEDVVREWVEEQGYNWTFVLDGDGAVSNKYEIKEAPTSYFIDPEGIIRVEKVGKMSLETMEANLLKAMNQE